MSLSDNNPTRVAGTGSTPAPTQVPPVGANDLAPPTAGTVATARPALTDTTVVTGETTRPSDNSGGGSKAKKAAFFAAATAFANTVRQEAPKKVREIREKRAAGRHVIVAEIGGRTVAVGPFPGGEDARRNAEKLSGTTRIVELVPASTYIPSTDDQR
jgi:poly-gamma-glutamate capsule biosynthesis protein CapA/YwtB (metallophosphatase superfamily)